jgi:NAD(P)H-hydrate epimerase
MARLIGRDTATVNHNRVEVARRFAQDHRCHVVLKGARTVIASPTGSVAINPTGNPGLASGGTGDVLAGILAGLLAQGFTVDDAVGWEYSCTALPGTWWRPKEERSA